MKTLHHRHTIRASRISYITQAIVNNFAPLLFLTFAREFQLSLDKITLITTLNFAVQLLVDLLCVKVIDRIGYRTGVVAAHVFSAVGIGGFALFPQLLGNAYAGILLSVVLCAVGGGVIEVLVSPIIEACPTDNKEAAISFSHGFYCWGHVLVTVGSTVFFNVFGIGNWRILACLWALLPFLNLFYFLAVPLYPVVAEHEKIPFGKMLGQKVFWILMVLMICSGAAEHSMVQWVSAFAESALQLDKTVGDLAGPCVFSVLMGLSRVIYGKLSHKLPLKKVLVVSGVLCIGCYLLAVLASSPLLGLAGCALCGFTVGLFWPGTFNMAAFTLRGGGTALYALLALAGDAGCSIGPTVVGFVADANGGDLKAGLATAMVFPLLICLLVPMLKDKKKA